VLLVCTVYSTVLYSEIALPRKQFGIRHMYIYNFLLRMTDTVTSEILTSPPGALCVNCLVFVLV
jgi:hypothetical protein